MAEFSTPTLRCRRCGATVEPGPPPVSRTPLPGDDANAFCLHPPITSCSDLAAQIADALGPETPPPASS